MPTVRVPHWVMQVTMHFFNWRMRRLTASGLLPERAGQPVKAWAHISLADLLLLDAGSALQDQWTAQVRERWAAHRAFASETGSELMTSRRWESVRVNSRGMCWTMSTAASRFSRRWGMISPSARGPPVDAAIATTSVADVIPFFRGSSLRTGAAAFGGVRTPAMFTALAAFSAEISASRTASRSMLIGPDGFLTNSMAPRSSARSVISLPRSDPAALNMTTGRGISLMICSRACSPSRRGISGDAAAVFAMISA